MHRRVAPAPRKPKSILRQLEIRLWELVTDPIEFSYFEYRRQFDLDDDQYWDEVHAFYEHFIPKPKKATCILNKDAGWVQVVQI